MSLRYLPAQTAGGVDKPGALQVFGITGHKGPLCSYAQVTAMVAGDFKTLPHLGFIALLVGSVGAFSALRQKGAEAKRNEKTWDELRADLEAEEGGRLLSGPPNHPPAGTMRPPRD